VLLEDGGTQQLIYKHAIATIVPSRPLKVFTDGDEENE
jgi:host factor-I protein